MSKMRYIELADSLSDLVSEDSGASFVIRVGFGELSDSPDSPYNSPLVVLEDGEPLGPSHSAHSLVREIGLGHHSHWGDDLYFSSSDNTDPRVNGRLYQFAIVESETSETIQYRQKMMIEAIEAGEGKLVIAVPEKLPPQEVMALKNDLRVVRLYMPIGEELHSSHYDGWLFSYEDFIGQPEVPNDGQLVLFGNHLLMPETTLSLLAAQGIRHFVCQVGDTFRPITLGAVKRWRMGERIAHFLRSKPQGSHLIRTVHVLRRVAFIRNAWKAYTMRQEDNNYLTPSDNSEEIYVALLSRAAAASDGADFVPGRVLHINAGLAAGGAERQVVNTLVGLHHRAKNGDESLEKISLLGEYVFRVAGLDFYKGNLDRAGIEVDQVQDRVNLPLHGMSSVSPSVGSLLSRLPQFLVGEILNLVEEFRDRKPNVIHVWQDSTSIKAGIAGVISGVPKIILSSRNVNPTNFSYYQDYMRPAYRALSRLPQVTLINNSIAGAKSYCDWLEVPEGTLTVIRNGVDLSQLMRASDGQVKELRHKLGIPDDADVIGSIFRFWQEKRPLLWIEAAREIINRRPKAHFLLVGDGPLRGEMDLLLNELGLKNRFHFLGEQKDIAVPLSCMNLFMLTSEFEGTPNVVLEAQWLGVPIILTEAGGSCEAVSEGETGEVADPTPDSLADAADAALTRISEYEGTWIAGTEFVRSTFGVDRMIDETMMLYSLNAREEGNTEI